MMLQLKVDNLTSLLILESMLDKKFAPIPLLLCHINYNIQYLGRRNLWCGILPPLLSQWILQKHILAA